MIRGAEKMAPTAIYASGLLPLPELESKSWYGVTNMICVARIALTQVREKRARLLVECFSLTS